MNTLLVIGLALVIGLIFTRIMKIIGLPFVTGYLIAGVLIGPYVFNLIQFTNIEELGVVVDVALGFIAFSIGSSFKLSNLKKIGGGMFVITLTQAFAAVILVDLALWAMGVDLPIVLSLGAIAAATAPAATLMVVRQYKAKGIVTDTLLPVVALDDAVGLVVFAVSISMACVFATGTQPTLTQMLWQPLGEIGLSLVIGAALGFILSYGSRLFKSRANRITAIIGVLFVGLALSQILNLSSLLLCMMIGAVYNNFFKECDSPLDVLDRWTHPLYMLFFVLSGAELNLKIIPTVGLIGVVYIVVRSIGKYAGATAGAAIVKADKNVVKYLGLTLLPQAGVAIGMAQMAVAQLPEEYGTAVNTVVLAATLVYELIGPLVTKVALLKAGEIDKDAFKPRFHFGKKKVAETGKRPPTVHDVVSEILKQQGATYIMPADATETTEGKPSSTETQENKSSSTETDTLPPSNDTSPEDIEK